MANTLLNISMITNEALDVIENNTVMAKMVTRKYDDRFGNVGAQIGDVINVRKPSKYVVQDGRTAVIQDTAEEYTAVTLDKQKHVAVEFSAKELALNINDFRKLVLEPQVVQIANKIDYDLCQLYLDIYNAAGTPATAITSLAVPLAAGAILDDAGCPRPARSAVMDPWSQAAMVNGTSSLFNAQSELSKQYESGTLGYNSGFKFSMDQNIAKHTNGALGGTPLVKGASQTGASIATDGWSNSTKVLLAGDIITLAGCYSVNPVSRISTGRLMQFVVTEDVTSDGSGNATIKVSPSIVTSGATQNATASPTNDGAVTLLGAAGAIAPVSLAFNEGAFCLVGADLYLPQGVDMAARAVSKKAGISIRMVRDFDIINDRIICRLDVLYGVKTLRPEFATRMYGKVGSLT